jgi:hypothetical protein
MTITNIRTRIVRAVAVGAAVVGMTLGASAPSADAAIGTMTAKLSISRLQGTGNVCSWDVTGVISMPQTEAQDLLNKGYRVIFRGWGDDAVYDDFIFGPDPASTTATSLGIEYKGTRGISCSVLDEDDSVFDDHDELYVGVRLVTGYLNGKYGPTVKSKESNRITGYF